MHGGGGDDIKRLRTFRDIARFRRPPAHYHVKDAYLLEQMNAVDQRSQRSGRTSAPKRILPVHSQKLSWFEKQWPDRLVRAERGVSIRFD